MLYRLSFAKFRKICIPVILLLFASQVLAQESKRMDSTQRNNVTIKDDTKAQKNKPKQQEQLPGQVIFEQLVDLFLRRLRHNPRVYRTSPTGVCVVTPREHYFFQLGLLPNLNMSQFFVRESIVFTSQPLFIWNWWRTSYGVIRGYEEVDLVEVRSFDSDEVLWKKKTMSGENYIKYDGRPLTDGEKYIVAFYRENNSWITHSTFLTMEPSMKENVVKQLELNRNSGKFTSDILADADYFSRKGLWTDLFSIIQQEKNYQLIAEKKLAEYSKKACSDTIF